MIDLASRIKPKYLSWSFFPEGLTRFNLDPTGARLQPKEIYPGVYALVSSKPGVNHTGFVIGDKGVLVIDAHISVEMAKQIQEAIRSMTSKPILFLVNSNHHGDHTFGNCAFPKETLIIQHRLSAELSPYHEEEKAFMFSSINNNPNIYVGMELRLPDLIYDDYLKIDLGGIEVEIHHFGSANTPGDTVTYIPRARIAFTGNMTGGGMVIALWTDVFTYLDSLSRFAQTLVVDTLIPSHSPQTTGDVLGRTLYYLADTGNEVMKAINQGWSLRETEERLTIKDHFLPPPEKRGAFNYALNHQYNVRKTYSVFGSERTH